MLFIGKNKDFTVVWNCDKQTYNVYKNGKYLINGHRFSEVKSYLN